MGPNSSLTSHKVVVPGCAVIIAAVIFCADDPPVKGEERFDDWSDETWHFRRLLMHGCLKYICKPTSAKDLEIIPALVENVSWLGVVERPTRPTRC